MLFSACEEQMVMIPEFVPPESERVIVLEELTGVNCPNCPAGSAVFEALLNQFNGSLVGYGVHGSFLTEPRPTSKYDFRNNDAVELEFYLSPFLGKPAAVVNRVFYDDQDYWSVDLIDLWQSLIAKELEKPHLLDLSLTPTYDAANRQLEIELNIVPKTFIEGELHMNISLSESHIIDPQETQGPLIEEYEHNHVLREILTDIRGDVFATNMDVADSTKLFYSYTLPAENGTWVAENMEVVAFVTNHFTDADENKTEEVVQAAAEHFVE